MNLQSLLRENIKQLQPYSTARDEFKGIAHVYLDANENPFPTAYNRYPDPHQKKLKEQLSKLKNTPPERIFLGNGSDEAIDLIIRAFCEPGKDSILITEPTYGMYGVCAGINGVSIKRTTLDTNFDLDLPAVNRLIDGSVKIIFLCSPNNPTGNLISKERIIQLMTTFNGIVVVDEAYIDFANDEGLLPSLALFPNLIILQTFSKAWGLAGLRLGMAFADMEIILVLSKIKYPYNISTLTQEVALKKLSEVEERDKQVAIILQERLVLEQHLSALPLVQRVYPSDANFILVKMTGARKIYEQLITQSIIVRDRSRVVLCDDCLRITVGTPEENQKLIKTLKTL